MTRLLTRRSLSLLASLALSCTANSLLAAPSGRIVAGELLIKLQTADVGAENDLRGAGARGLRAFKLKPSEHTRELERWRVVKIPPNMTEEQALEHFKKRKGIQVVEYNYMVTPGAIKIPNDPRFGEQWSHINNGETVIGSGAKADIDLDTPEAWDYTTGSNSVTVAVLDTGIEYTHPDLAANMWVNSGEIANNNIDDDNNGFVDDINGYDFYNLDKDPNDEWINGGHGTHVAGIIAAVGNNKQGITGIAWNAKIMALKMFDSANGNVSVAIDGINYAVAKGAHIINGSWTTNGYSQALRDALQAANNAGVLYVAAAGNDAMNVDATPRYPACFDLPNIISVAATEGMDQITSFSNYGSTCVDLAAPGYNILSTIRGGLYDVKSGTSMSAPTVAGVAALLKAQRSTRTAPALRNLILSNVDKTSLLTPYVASGGRVNANAALSKGLQGAQTYAQMKLRGTFNSWGSTPMALVDDHTWQGIVTFSTGAGDAFKFDVNGDWVTSFGDNNADGIAEQGGGNIAITQGTSDYKITFNDLTRAYTLNKVTLPFAKSYNQVYFRGTPNKWGLTAMQLISHHNWQTTVTVTPDAGNIFKIDIYGDWSTGFGDNNADGIAEQNGSNIIFNQGYGQYTVTFNDQTKAYQLQKLSPQKTYNQLYVRSSFNNWANTAMSLTSNNTWQVVVTYPGNGTDKFKFDVFGNWATNFGDNNVDGIGDLSGADILIGQGPGDYLITFNDISKAYSAVKVGYAKSYPQVHLRGTHNNWAAGNLMGLVADYTWAAKTNFGSAPTKQYKFDIHGNWSIAFGDNNGDFIADQNGNNINITSSNSVFVIRFNDKTKSYSSAYD